MRSLQQPIIYPNPKGTVKRPFLLQYKQQPQCKENLFVSILVKEEKQQRQQHQIPCVDVLEMEAV